MRSTTETYMTVHTLQIKNIDQHWSLFLDRDGVINYEKENNYILNWNEFIFYEGVLKALSLLSQKFNKIILVTNQRGVGKGLMNESALSEIHSQLKQVVEASYGRLDGMYTCTSINDNHPDRKPNPGMALAAQKDFPEIIFSKSIMVGNKLSDMKFGRNAGMHNIFLATTHPETVFPHPDIDLRFNSLLEFAKAL